MSLRLIAFFVLLVIFAAYDYMTFMPPPPGCANPGYKQINIVRGPSQIVVTPHRKDVYAGDALRFNITGPGSQKVVVSPKVPANSWPSFGSYSTVVVCVPAGTPSGDYEYKVTVIGVGYLDPIVRILN
jgi:hypothetical protein